MPFKPSKTVTKLATGRVRDDEFDAVVKMANDSRGTVFEDTVTAERAEEIRKGVERSVKYLNDESKSGVNLNVAVAKEFETLEDGNVIVRLSAGPKSPRKRAESNGSADESAAE
jgi:hypothetical protein